MDQTTALLRVLGRSLVRELGVVESASSPNDLPLSHCHILVELDQNGTLTAKELSDRLVVDKSAISRAVAQLCDSGLILLRDDPIDKRRRHLALTAAGQKKVAQIHRAADDRVREALTLLSADAQDAVANGMRIYVEALTRARRQKSFSIRATTRRDQPDLVRLLATARADTEESWAGAAANEGLDALRRAQSHADGRLFIVVDPTGRPVGCAGVSLRRNASNGHGRGRVCDFNLLYLLPEARGIGIGRLLMERCLVAATELSCGRCFLTVKPEMVAARKLSERFGFLPTTMNSSSRLYAKDLAP